MSSFGTYYIYAQPPCGTMRYRQVRNPMMGGQVLWYGKQKALEKQKPLQMKLLRKHKSAEKLRVSPGRRDYPEEPVYAKTHQWVRETVVSPNNHDVVSLAAVCRVWDESGNFHSVALARAPSGGCAKYFELYHKVKKCRWSYFYLKEEQKDLCNV